MFAGKHINSTEDRAVLHVALRAPRDGVGDAQAALLTAWTHVLPLLAQPMALRAQRLCAAAPQAAGLGTAKSVLRALGRLQEIVEGGQNVVAEVWQVLDKIKAFSGGWVGRWWRRCRLCWVGGWVAG